MTLRATLPVEMVSARIESQRRDDLIYQGMRPAVEPIGLGLGEPGGASLGEGDALAHGRVDAPLHLVQGLGQEGLGFLLRGEGREPALAVLVGVVGDPGGFDLAARPPDALADRCLV